MNMVDKSDKNKNVNFLRKIKIYKYVVWSHHRSGWKFIMGQIAENLHSDYAPCWLEGYTDGLLIRNEEIRQPWIGFWHNTIVHPDPKTSGDKYKILPSLTTGLQLLSWKAMMPFCKGIFTLCEYTRQFLSEHIDVPVISLFHPSEDSEIKFSFEKFLENKDKKLVQIGHWMRKIKSIGEVKSPFRKCYLKPGQRHKGFLNKDISYLNGYYNTHVLDTLSDCEFDLLLEKNIVFLDLYDVAACNTIVDCLVRNTPLLITKLPAAVEYLGKDYPFYFENLEEAAEKLNLDTIEQTHQYLKNKNKDNLRIEFFLNEFVNSSIYHNLPRPFL
jgi:hypothetical protein